METIGPDTSRRAKLKRLADLFTFSLIQSIGSDCTTIDKSTNRQSTGTTIDFSVEISVSVYLELKKRPLRDNVEVYEPILTSFTPNVFGYPSEILDGLYMSW